MGGLFQDTCFLHKTKRLFIWLYSLRCLWHKNQSTANCSHPIYKKKKKKLLNHSDWLIVQQLQQISVLTLGQTLQAVGLAGKPYFQSPFAKFTSIIIMKNQQSVV